MAKKKEAVQGAANTPGGRENDSTDTIISFPRKVNADDYTWREAETRRDLLESKVRAKELVSAMLTGVPVNLKTLGGTVRYGWISGLIYQLFRNKTGETTDKVCMRVELTDAQADSIAIAAPKDVFPVWIEGPPETEENLMGLIHEDSPIDIGMLKEALVSFHTVLWDGEEYRSVRAVIFRPDGDGGIYVTVDLADAAGKIINVPADQIEITDHMWNR